MLLGPDAVLGVRHDRGGLALVWRQLVDLGVDRVRRKQLTDMRHVAAGHRSVDVPGADVHLRMDCVVRPA